MVVIKNKIVVTLWFVAFAAFAAQDSCVAVNVAMDQDGRSFTVTVPGVMAFRSGFGIKLNVDGTLKELYSADGMLVHPVVHAAEATPYGQAAVTETTLRFEKEQIELILRLGQVPGVTGLLAQAGVRNIGKQPFGLYRLMPVVLAGEVTGNPEEWLLTALNSSDNPKVTTVVALNEINEPLDVQEYGALYRQDRAGFLFGPVGLPISYVYARIGHSGNNNISMKLWSQMSGVLVDPGELRWGQQVVLLMEPPRSALARWAEWVAKTHGNRTDKGALSGWNSWYFLGGNVSGKDVMAVTDEVLKFPDRLRPGVIAVDNGYQEVDGQKEDRIKFPEGLAFYAQRIATTGARPGLYLPFNGMADKMDWPQILQRVRNAAQSGFTFMKLDFSYFNVPSLADPKKTSLEVMREKLSMIRKAAGDNVYLLGSGFRPDRAALGFMDASRTCRMMDRSVVRAMMSDVLCSYQLNGRWFAVDNDAYYMGTDISNVSEISGGWPVVRTWMSMVGLSCGMASTSDPWYWDSFKPYWRNVEVMTPPARERTEVLDLCVSKDWPRLIGHVKRDWGDWTVALLWNPDKKERVVKLDFAEAGLDPKRRYAVWSFWDNRYLGVSEGSWTTPALAPSASQHLSFTDLDRDPNRPVLIGSGLHIYSGAAEIKNVVSRSGTMEIEMTDAGARDGDLFVYSRWMPFLRAADGCTVRSVANAGENAWRISIVERKSGLPQRISLGIMLPVTRQAWFWGLIALVAGSLLFAMWRYIVGLRLQRQNALEQERTRIARDLHDDLGSNLTQIAYLGDTLLNRPGLAPDLGGEINKMRATARDLTRSLDETVWAVDPAHDNLDSLAGYLTGLAQETFSATDIHCRFDFPDNIPLLQVSADVRHNLFLAFKEALHNIIRHAHASEVNIKLVIQPPDCKLVIADNGCGFEAEAAKGRPGGGHGLGNIRKRLEEIGGSCEIHSRPGAGTELQFAWRLQL